MWPFELRVISYFSVVMHTTPYKIALTFGSVNEA